MNHPSFIPQIRELIARDELKAAIDQLRIFFEKTPKLDEILHQSGRFEHIRQQIRLGTVSHPEANLTQNQIRAALLDLISEIETQGQQPALRAEMERAVVVENSKNVVVGATITAGGNVDIGDKYTTVNNEGTTNSNQFNHSTLNNPVFYQYGERKIPRPPCASG